MLCLASILAFNCAGNRYNVDKSEPKPTEFNNYTFSDKNLPDELLRNYRFSLKNEDYNKSFSEYLKDVDKSDDFNDNYISNDSFTNYKFKMAFSELDKAVSELK